MTGRSPLTPVHLGEAVVPSIAVEDVADVTMALDTAIRLGSELPQPGAGSTAVLWTALATIGAQNLEAVRAIEPHLDAIAILHQAGADALAGAGDRWGVFAAEGPDPVVASRVGGDAWVLDGVKPWCSLADRLDAALVSATLPDGARGLFAVDLADGGVQVEPATWHARGLAGIPSVPIRLTEVPARAVGGPGWYLDRPGFEWGGLGVAACWFGGLVGLSWSLRDAARRRPERDITAMHLGAVDAVIWTCERLLADAALRVDDGRAVGVEGRLLAKRVRATVAAAAEETIVRVGHALGPAPLALDAEHVQRVADLQLYIRQHHAEADLASLGRASAESSRW